MKSQRLWVRTAWLTLVAGLAFALYWTREAARNHGPLRHEAYVWQRSWTQPVREAVQQEGTNFSRLILLRAEISWQDDQPQLVRIALDPASLTNSPRSIGLALRVGSYGGPFTTNDPASRFVIDSAAALVATAKAQGLVLSEFQIDFDCAESKLEGYRVWVEAIQARVTPLPVTITALPSWLNAAAFESLVRQATNYVLQVHSLDRTVSATGSITLCDPRAARRAVERAGRIGIPFRVALPTYGYLLAFKPDGALLGISAETPRPDWPTNAMLRTIQADADELAGLVQGWTRSRPAALGGVIWFRLPTKQDSLNWDWARLQQVMKGAAAQ